MSDFSDQARQRPERGAVNREIDRLIGDARDLIDRHRPSEATVSARSALALVEEHEMVMPPQALLNLGDALSDLYDNAAALDCYRLARDRFIVDGDERDIAHVDMNEAIVLNQLGRHDDAVALLEGASVVFEEYGPSDDLDACRVNLTVALRAAGRIVEAIEVGRTAVEAARVSDDRRVLPDALTNSANALLEDGDREAARVAYIEALDLFRKLDLSTEEADCLDGLGVIARHDGLLDFAASMHTQAIAMYEGCDHDVDQAIARYNLAITELWRGNNGVALREAMLACDAPVTVLDPSMVVAVALDRLGRADDAEAARAGFVERHGDERAAEEAALLP